ncbi:LysR substrate-binding domain-containing protein [Acetobacter senegalensis]|uniref:LysR substrate-binding domain-containing protein n=1 Tax=Acetobacter senegalensis TaxID=446692 RepID=UPI0020A0CB19|nr:LysR substrate-binding domain-containing protein [Acetobacter senegalensis]MCP1194709.1 LysR substrate-binding domain-containing protein [Acetobacter senegalensis]
MTPNQADYLLRSLRLIETVGRCGSFSTAALELGMTQPAVSQQVAQLEKLLGVVLFERRHRGVSATRYGQMLHTTTTDVLTQLYGIMEIIHGSSSRETLTILTDYGFAANWLLPRLSDFEEKHPEIDVSLLTTQARRDARIDHRNTQHDVSILFGEKPQTHDISTICLFQEEIVPICSTVYLKVAGPFNHPHDLLEAKLLHLSGPDHQWFTWADWFQAVDASCSLKSYSKNGLFFGNYPLLLQAVLQNQGIALGWRPLIDDLVKTDQVIVLNNKPIKSRRGYFLSTPLNKKRHIDSFIQWILAQSKMNQV